MKKLLLLVLLGCLSIISTSILAADPNDNCICYKQTYAFYGCLSFWDDFTDPKHPYQRRAPGGKAWYYNQFVKINIKNKQYVEHVHLSGYSEGSPYIILPVKVQAGSTIETGGPTSKYPHYSITYHDPRCVY